MGEEARLTEVLFAIRMANNMLCEVQNNHGDIYSAEAARHMHSAVRALAEADRVLRQQLYAIQGLTKRA